MSRIVTRGFTLIELLVAVLITAIVFVLGYSALNQAFNARANVEQSAARLLQVQAALHAFEQDLQLLQPRPVRAPFGSGYEAALLSGATSGGGFASSSLSQQAAAVLTITRSGWTNPAGLPRSELQRASYVLENGTLIRQHLPVLDAAGESTLRRRELLRDVEEISFRFMDDGFQWRTQWPAGGAPSSNAPAAAFRLRPLAVEVTLKLKDYGTLMRVIEVLG